MSGGPKQRDVSSNSGNQNVDNPCGFLQVDSTVLQSPIPSVLGELHIGDKLNIIYDESLRTLKAITEAGKFAGTILCPKNPNIIACISRGFIFLAIVVSINGGNCTVSIKHNNA